MNKENEYEEKLNGLESAYFQSISSVRSDAERETVKVNFTNRLKKFSNDLTSKKNELTQNINSIKYPDFSSPDISKKQFGSSEIQAAWNYLSSPKTKEQILATLDQSHEMKRTDFVSALIDELFKSKSSLELRSEVAKRDYFKDKGLDELSDSIKRIDRVNRRSNDLLNIIDAGLNKPTNIEEWKKFQDVQINNNKSIWSN